MKIQSNVAIKSNIYVNKTKSLYDKDFIRQVRGYTALKSLQGELLTKAQQEEVKYGTPDCSLDKSGDKSWGLIIENDLPVFVCKCEKTDCTGWGKHQGYSECSNLGNFKKTDRIQEPEILGDIQYVAPDFGLLRYLDAEDKIVYLKTVDLSSKKFKLPEITIKPKVPEGGGKEPQLEQTPKTEQNEKLDEKAPSMPGQKAMTTQPKIVMPIEYRKIDTPQEIIETKIDEQVIVNAGPGTGKTYSVIKRLGYIINHELADPTNVLVLCYSRSAVSVIKKRINAEIIDGNMPVEATQFFNGIRTFDSFVTYLLADDEPGEMINNLNYDERIERFIAEIKKDKTVFEGLEYLIVDEMQDLVGVRARMVQTILEEINCGFMLLGDMCQSIYDYQIQDISELNSFRYYKWLNSKFNTDVKRFELTKNVRQKAEIAKLTEDMRSAILSENTEKQVESLALCVGTLQKDYFIGNIRTLGQRDPSKSEAILCRNNAEVSIISSELFSKDIAHRISKKAQHVDLVPWIAEILSTYTENRIGATAFKERVLSAGYHDPDAKWSLLKAVASDGKENVLDVKLLVKTLVEGKDLPSELDLANSDVATVSTIHRAKGREYDSVLLISDDYNRSENTLDEIKVAYVALTRGKGKISFCNTPTYYTRQLASNRWIATGRSKKSKKYYCSHFDIGLDDDINPYSFVNKTIEDATERQKHIATLKPGDLLEAWFLDRAYKIFHNGVYIGMLSDKIFRELRDAMDKTNRSPNLPNHMSNIYVNNVITIANTRFNDVIAEPYNKSGLWLGVEISGFAKTDWS